MTINVSIKETVIQMEVLINHLQKLLFNNIN